MPPLQTYEVHLKSETDGQERFMSIQAPSPGDAGTIAERAEQKLVDFSLLPPEKDVWECPPGSTDDEVDGHVNLARWDAYHPDFAAHAAQLPYDEAVSAAHGRLAELEQRVDVKPNGKLRATSLPPRAVARLFAHKQAQPYAIQTIELVDQAEIDRRRTMKLLARLREDPAAWDKTLDQMRAMGIPVAAVTAALYGIPWQKQIDGSSVTVYSSATVKTSLHTAYTANVDTDDFFNDVSGTEITGTGYTAGGATLASKTSTYDTATDQTRLDAADVSWTTSTLSATDAVVWVDTAGASTTDPVWGNVDFGGTVSTTAGTFLITWDATGIVVFDVT